MRAKVSKASKPFSGVPEYILIDTLDELKSLQTSDGHPLVIDFAPEDPEIDLSIIIYDDYMD